MAAEKGNQLWKIRKTHGRNPIFSSPDQMLEDCYGYFEWVENNPLMEAKAFSFQGEGWIEPVPKMRAMTITGLCVYLGIHTNTWKDYKKRDDFIEVTSAVEQIIYDQKFTGAAADLLNSNIIARDLGLSDKKDHSSTDGSMTPKAAIEISPDAPPKDAANIYRDMMKDDS